MLSYAALCRHSGAFPSLTGMTRPEFEALADQFERAEQESRERSATTRRSHAPRHNAPGAGRPHDHGHHDRLLMALVWLRIYPTYEVLGFFFDLHKRNAQLNVRAVLEVLDTLHDFPFDRPTRDRTKLRSAAEVMTAFPQVRVVIDGKEQRTNRPAGYDAQKPYYSGKKKTHTLKNQVVVDPCGRIETVTETVPGGANHDLTVLRGSGVLERLGEGEGAMVDKGYVGVRNDYPDVPIVIPFKASRNHPLTADQEAFNREVARYRIVVEHTMAQLNRFTVLRQVFRGHKRDRHSRVFRVVAKLVNRRLAVKPLKTYAA
jgi:DDE superfamily endonuclease/Helix-turn-helix of DDE superfamily endonuclease